MPRFAPVARDKVEQLTKRQTPIPRIDLSEFVSAIRDAVASSDGWGEVVIEPDDNRRAIQRRLTVAGKETGYAIKLHKRSSNDTTLVYRAVAIESTIRRMRAA